MNRLKLLLLILSSLTSLLLMAQPPGYLGKRASVTFNISGLPAYNGPSLNNRGRKAFGEKKKGIGINYEFEFDFSYVVARYKSLGLKIGQYYTGTETYARTETISDMDNSSDRDEHYLFNRLNVRSIGLVYSKFKRKKGAIAPIGNRFYWGLKRTFVTAEIIDKRTVYGGDGLGIVYGHAPLTYNQNVAFNLLTMGWSNNQIFWDKLILKTGFRFSIPLFTGGLDYQSTFRGSNNQDNFDKRVIQRVASHELFRFDIGIGYLLF